VALWLDEPFAPVDATVAAAVGKATVMLEEAGAIINESARPAFSFEEAISPTALCKARTFRRGGRGFARSGTFFEHIDAVVCPSAPLGPSGDRKPDPRAINCGRLQTKAAFRSDAVGLSCHWRRFAGRRGSGVAGRRPNHRRELRGPRGHHLRRDARSTSAQGLRPPPMASP
jgi:hypothetical protein